MARLKTRMLELGSTDDWSVLGPIEYQAPAATIATPSEPIYGYDEPRDHSNDCKWNMEARQTVVAGALIGPRWYICLHGCTDVMY